MRTMLRIQLSAHALIISFFVLASCGRNSTDPSEAASPTPRRFGSVTGLKQEKVAYYKQLHAETWPGVLKKLKECNIRNYSIYLHEIDGKPYLFSYYEYVGDNYEKDMERIAADSTTQAWWRETDPCQLPLPEATTGNKIWTEMEEVFHTN